jgi:hypothetical protein
MTAAITEPFACLLCMFDIVNQYEIVLFCPYRREKSHIGPQLPTGMRSCEICQIGGQGNIVFWVENV